MAQTQQQTTNGSGQGPRPAIDAADLLRQIEALRAEKAALEEANTALKKTAALTMKVSEKGALSVYGMGRFPVTLYREQWERLFTMADDIRAFIKANAGALKGRA